MTTNRPPPGMPITNETALELDDWLFAAWTKELGLEDFEVSPGKGSAVLPQSTRLQFANGAVCGQVLKPAGDTISALAISTSDRTPKCTVYQHTHFLRHALPKDLRVQAKILRFG